MHKVAVIILNWNGLPLMEKFLPSLIMHTTIPGCRLVVADNNSSDDSVEYVKKTFPDIQVLEFDKNYGFAGGYNRAIEIIDDEFVVLLNSDVELSENWLQPLLDVFEEKENVAGVMPKILNYNQKDFFEYAGAAGGFIDKLGFTFCRGRIFNSLEKDNGQYNKLSKVFWVSGACFCTKRDLYIENGGLDERFFAHMEEIDLCWRFLSRGYNLYCQPASKVFHVGGATLSANNSRKTYLNFRNNLFLLYKNLPAEGFLKTMLLRLCLDGVAAAKFLFSFQLDNFFAVLDAHFAFYSSINKMKNARRNNLLKSIVYKHEEMFMGSIVYSYYSGKITNFDKLKLQNSDEQNSSSI